MMDSIFSPFTEVMRRIQLNRPALPYVSNVTGTWITADQATDPAYYAQHLRQTVRFADGVAALANEPTRALLAPLGSVGAVVASPGAAVLTATLEDTRSALLALLQRAKIIPADEP